jgi:multiple sugar transport system ATP-binding protein
VLYSKPSNVFVAGFIGSPAMNFFDVTIVGTKDDMYLDGGTFRVQVPQHKAQPLQDHLGRQVVFGIRPEDVHDPEYAPPGIIGAAIKCRVDVTELMGNEVFLYLVTGTKTFIARVDPRTSARVGQDVEMLINMDNTQIFDRDTEASLY